MHLVQLLLKRITSFFDHAFSSYRKYGIFTLCFCSIFLIVLGALAAKACDSSIRKAVIRITFLGKVAMGLTALVGYLFNVNVG